MSTATKGLALPIGTKVRRKSTGQIMERDGYQDKDGAGFYYLNTCGMARGLFLDDEWELIEEKQEPKQGDNIEVRGNDEDDWELVVFVAFYRGYIICDYDINHNISHSDFTQWRFPPKKLDITLKDIADWKGVGKELINIINE